VSGTPAPRGVQPAAPLALALKCSSTLAERLLAWHGMQKHPTPACKVALKHAMRRACVVCRHSCLLHV
jgi:hypothetical protein